MLTHLQSRRLSLGTVLLPPCLDRGVKLVDLEVPSCAGTLSDSCFLSHSLVGQPQWRRTSCRLTFCSCLGSDLLQVLIQELYCNWSDLCWSLLCERPSASTCYCSWRRLAVCVFSTMAFEWLIWWSEFPWVILFYRFGLVNSLSLACHLCAP